MQEEVSEWSGSRLAGGAGPGAGAGGESEIRTLRRENQQLLEELSMMQQAPREELYQKERVMDVMTQTVQLRVTYNNTRAGFLAKEKVLHKLAEKLYQMQLAMGEQPLTLPSIDKAKAKKQRGSGKTTHAEKEQSSRVAMLQSLQSLQSRMADLDSKMGDSDLWYETLRQIKGRLSKQRLGMESQYSQMKAKLDYLAKKTGQKGMAVKQINQEHATLQKKMERLKSTVDLTKMKRAKLKADHKSKEAKQEEMAKYLREREDHRAELIQAMKGDMDRVEELKMKQKSKALAVESTGNKIALHYVQKLEAAFQKAANRMGEKDFNFLLRRLDNLDGTQEELDDERDEKENRVAELKRERGALLQQLKEIQLNGVDFSHRRTQLDKLENRLEESISRAKDKKKESETLHGKLVPLQAGLEAINIKLESVKVKKDEGAKDKLAIPAVVEKTDYNENNEEEEQDPIMELLESIDTRLTGIIEKVQEATSDGAQEYQMLSPGHEGALGKGLFDTADFEVAPNPHVKIWGANDDDENELGRDDLDFDLASSSRLYKQAAKRVDPQKSKGLRKRLEQRGQNRKSLA